MSGCAVFSPFHASATWVMEIPPTRGPMKPGGGTIIAQQRLASDSIGSCQTTFSGVNANSEIRVYFPDGTEAAGVELCNANHQLSWNVFPIGSANNTVTIRIVHPQYKIKEFQYTASLGAQAIPIQQEPDKWYSNPV